ncbi:MAG: cation:proton antiporter [Verrucomicrobia bacterium]|nr:cation:proton antiporter [Verrucomicrobiota bacterium]
MNPTAIESHLKLVLLEWMVIMAVAWFFGRAGQKVGQPLAVGEITGGLLLGPSLLGALWPEGFQTLFPSETQQSLQLLAKIGLILLLFQVGMEFDYGHLAQRSRTVTAVSLMGIAAPMLGGLLLGPWLHREFGPGLPYFGFQLFVCIALSISALPIMGRILLEMKLERTAIGAMAISSAAIDDVVGWILLAVATALVTSRFDLSTLGAQAGGVLVLFVVLHKFVGPWLRRLWQKSAAANGEGFSASYLALLLSVLFTCCLITNVLGIFSIFGAFLLGTALHQEVGLVKTWREKFADFVVIALVPIFFTNTGLRTEIGSLTTGKAWLGCALVLAMATAGKLGGCYLGAHLTGQPRRDAACIAALMNTRALMGLVAINIGLELKLLTRELFTMFVIMCLVTTAMCGPLLRWWLPAELHPKGNG